MGMKYQKPVIIPENGMSEGIYAASGENCYRVSYTIHQLPQHGRMDYRIQMNAAHVGADGHHSGNQLLIITFNQPVEYESSNGSYRSGSGSNVLQIEYTYHNNAYDNIGLGDVVVRSEPGLAIQNAVLSCNHTCAYH